jgi:hypothetical protein
LRRRRRASRKGIDLNEQSKNDPGRKKQSQPDAIDKVIGGRRISELTAKELRLKDITLELLNRRDRQSGG